MLIGMLSLGMFFEIYELLLTPYIAPGLVADGILTTTTPGIFGTTGVASFIAALFLGLFIGTLTCGFLADRFGRRSIFTFALLWYAAAATIMACQTTALGLNFWRFVSGLGLGVEMMTIGAYLSELVPKQIRGRAFAVSLAIGYVAVPVAAFLSYLLVPHSPAGVSGWRWVVGIGAVGAVFVWWLRRVVPESPRWLAQQGRLQEADQILGDLERRVTLEHGGPLPLIAPWQPPVPERSKLRDLWVRPYGRRTLMLSVFHVFQTIGYYGFASWVPTLLISQGISVTHGLLYGTIIALAAPLGPLLFVFVADRFERKHVIVTMSAANIVCGLAFSQATDALALTLLGAVISMAGGIISCAFHAYQQELFPTGIRARASGFVYSWSRISAVFNAFFVAYFLRRFGGPGVFLFIAAALSIVMLVIGAMGPRTRNVALEELSA
jgi:putative MFS transporter